MQSAAPIIDEPAADVDVEPLSLSRKAISRDRVRRLNDLRKVMAAAMQEFLAEQISSIVDGLRGIAVDPERSTATSAKGKSPPAAAIALVESVFHPAEWTADLKAAASRPLAQAMTEGAVAEVILHAAALKARGIEIEIEIGVKRTTAEEAADEIDVPEGIALDFPDWLKGKIATELEDLFKQPYWQKISETTRDDVSRTVGKGLADGWSIRRIADEIESKHGGTYTRARAKNIAKTECADAMNAGHSLGMERLAEETGMEIGKEWLSILGNTTRDTHAALDGVTSDSDGMFDLAGYRIPWPAHRSLPPSERCNCACSILSAFVSEVTADDGDPTPAVEPVEDGQLPATPAEPADEPAPPTQAELDAMPVIDALEAAVSLEAKRQAVIEAGKALAAAVAELQAEEQSLIDEWREIQDRRLEISGDVSPGAEEESRQLVERLQKVGKRLEEVRAAIVETQGETFKASLSAIILPKAERVAFKPEMHKRGLSETRGGQQISTGKFSDEFRRKAREALSFLQSITSNRGRTISKETISQNLRFHSTDPGVRAFQRGPGGSGRGPAKTDEGWGVFLDERDGVNTFAHEVMHHIENTLPGAQRRANEFVEERIRQSGKPDVRLADVLPAHGYRADEMGNDDDFAKAFAGRPEDEAKNFAFYAGKRYAGGDTEILTIGIERFIQDAPAFAAADPQWFKLVLGILDGTIR